jgi:hypothetical protein
MASFLPPLEVAAPSIAASVACRYIGANTRHTCEKRDACVSAIACSSGSTWRFASSVF